MKRLIFAVAMLMSVSFWSLDLHAQDDEGVARVWQFHVKQGMQDAFEQAVKAYHATIEDAEGRFSWDWWVPVSGDDIGSYFARTGGHNWADFDATHDWQKEAGHLWQTTADPMVESYESTFTVTNYELSNLPGEDYDLQVVHVTDWYVREGHARAFYEGLGTIVATLKESDDWDGYWSVIGTVAGGKGGNRVQVVGFGESWADMAEPSPTFMEVMIAKMGEEEAHTMVSNWAKTLRVGESTILVKRDDLSY